MGQLSLNSKKERRLDDALMSKNPRVSHYACFSILLTNSFVRYIDHRTEIMNLDAEQLKDSSAQTKGGEIGFISCTLQLRPNLRSAGQWPLFFFQLFVQLFQLTT